MLPFPISNRRVEKRCIRCDGSLIDPNSVFCPYCGTDQTIKENTATPIPMNRCLDCGSPVEPPLIFCDQCVMKQNQASLPSDPALQPITGRYVHQQQVSNIPVTQQRYAPVQTQPACPPFVQQAQVAVQPMVQQGYVQQQVSMSTPIFPQQQEQNPPAPPPPVPPGYGGLQ